MATAAYNLEFQVGGSPCGSLNNASLSLNGDILDTTSFEDGTYKTKISGLRDWSVSVSGDLDPSSAQMQGLLAGYTGGSTVAVVLQPTGVTTCQFSGNTLVESFEISGAVDGKVEVSVSLQGTGSLTATMTA